MGKTRRIFTAMLAMMALVAAVASCGGNLDMMGMFWTLSENVDARFERSMAYNDTHPFKTIRLGTDNYRVYVCTDVHVDSTTRNLDRFVGDFISDRDAAPFCLCLGDVINARGNYPRFFEHIRPVADAGLDFFCTAGNHDLYYNQWEQFWDTFGTSSYSFEVVMPGSVKDFYLSLDSGSATLGRKQREWAEDVLRQASSAGYRHIIVFTHTHFFNKDKSQGHCSNYEIEETYDLMSLFSKYGVDLVLTGHDHFREIDSLGGVEYRILDALEDADPEPYYGILEVSPKAFDVDYISVK